MKSANLYPITSLKQDEHDPGVAYAVVDRLSRQPPPETFKRVLDGYADYLGEHWRRLVVNGVVKITVFIGVMVLVASLVASCTTGERMSFLEEGMTPEQVASTIGSPAGQARQGEFLQYSYPNRMMSGWGYDRADYYAIFEGERLVAWGAENVRQNRPPINTLMVLDPLAPYQQPAAAVAPAVVIQQQPGTYVPSYYP